MTLPDFLLARITDREGWAQEALDLSDGLGATVEWRWVRFYNRTADPNHPSSSSFYPGAPSPAEVLARCKADRRIVALHVRYDDVRGCQCDVDPCPALCLLALPFADHPDYDPAWAV